MRDAVAAAAVERELGTFSGRDAIQEVLPEIRRLLDTGAVLVLAPVEAAGGLEVARFQSLGFADPERVRAGFADVFWRQPRRYAWYDPICPEPAQRNRVLEAHSLMGPGELESSYIYERLLQPCGLSEHRQPRVLLCEGASLLAWFGAFQAGPVASHQLRMLRRLARPMRRRLALERRLGVNVRAAALHVALDAIAAPAFVVSASGRIIDSNAAGRVLSLRPGAIHDLLRAGDRTEELCVERIELRERGCPDAYLAIVRSGSRRSRIAARVAAATRRWSLTERQAQVLAAVVGGHATATIAAELAVSTRAVEAHISVLLRRAGVDNRAALVALALL